MTGTLRVVGGAWRGRRLAVLPGSRPTSERAREALFDILGDGIRGKRVLELFAGSGAVILEALSRGAAEAVAVERDPRALTANARSLGAPVESIGVDAAAAVRRLASSGRAFDLVFVDPPYGDAALSPADVAPLAAPGGRVVWQSDAGGEPDPPEGWRASRVARYGRNVFTFFERE